MTRCPIPALIPFSNDHAAPRPAAPYLQLRFHQPRDCVFQPLFATVIPSLVFVTPCPLFWVPISPLVLMLNPPEFAAWWASRILLLTSVSLILQKLPQHYQDPFEVLRIILPLLKARKLSRLRCLMVGQMPSSIICIGMVLQLNWNKVTLLVLLLLCLTTPGVSNGGRAFTLHLKVPCTLALDFAQFATSSTLAILFGYCSHCWHGCRYIGKECW